MSEEHSTDLDQGILAAFEALDATVSEGYFDDFETRLQARIEETAMTDLSDPTAAGSDDQELRDIRALAEKTKLRVSQRMSAVKPPDEPLISSVSLALKAISLPEPGKDFKFFALDDVPRSAAAVANDERDAGLPAWIYAAISAVAAAAIVFFVLRGGDRQERDRGVQVAAIEDGAQQAVPGGLAPGAPAPESGVGGVVPGGAGLGSTPQGVPAGVPDGEARDPGSDGSAASTADGNAATGSGGAAKRSSSGASKRASGARADNKSARKRAEDKPADGAGDTASTAAPAEKKKQQPDTLESLLAEASGSSTGDKAGKPGDGQSGAAAKPTRVKIESSEVRAKMSTLSGKTRACYEKYQQTGMVKVKFGVARSGKITSAVTTGKFKNTDTGKCVAAAVKSVSFPPFSGPPMTFTWPFLLTQ